MRSVSEIMDRSLPSSLVASLEARLRVPASRALSTAGPVHVVYGGAHLFTSATIDKLGARARSAMDTWGSDAEAFGRAVGVSTPELAREVQRRVRDKLARHPVEAICIDFEDGYGPRSDAEEDAEAIRVAEELAKTAAEATAIGIRVKALDGATLSRAVRTLDLFVTRFAKATGGASRAGFTVTLPKVASVEQVGALVELLEKLESSLGIERTIGVELMIESPRALFDGAGLAIPALVSAARDRAVAIHLGAYDLTAELGVTAVDQRLDHPLCDLARSILQLSAALTGVRASDGATTLLPIPPKGLSGRDAEERVHRAWSLHATHVRRAVDVGLWQGWDLHPAQIPARYGALYGYFLSRKDEMTARLSSFVDHAARASRVAQVFDDAATGNGLLAFFRRGLSCGALDETDVRATSLSMEELSRSFADIVVERARTSGPPTT